MILSLVDEPRRSVIIAVCASILAARKLATVSRLLLALLWPSSLIERPAATAGTSIIYIQTPNAVWVGADSLNIQLKTGARDLHASKIHHVGNIYFAFAGANELGDVYDAVDVAKQAINSNATTEEARDRFVSSITPLFEKAIPVLRKFYPQYYNESWENPNPKFQFFEIIFFSFENGSTSVKYAAFHVQKSASGQRSVKSERDGCSRRDCSEKGILRSLGKNKVFTPDFNPQTVANGEPVATIRKIIQMEIAAEPKWVGGDINIVRIDAYGAHWETPAPY